MTLDELMSLRRGDVVAWLESGSLGLVRHVGGGGLDILWEDGDFSGPYCTPDDAAMLTIFSKGPR